MGVQGEAVLGEHQECPRVYEVVGGFSQCDGIGGSPLIGGFKKVGQVSLVGRWFQHIVNFMAFMPVHLSITTMNRGRFRRN